MSLILSILAKMDAGQAKAELRALSGELDKGKAGITGLGDASGRTAPRLADQARQAEALAKSNHVAAGSTANLTANLNDVFMMIAAGQNPLQLAMQQGTQITQVLGPMGAAGAARALGGAFVSALNPFNFLVLGVIAGGAAIVQWLTGADAEAKTLGQSVDDLGGTVKEFRDASSRSLNDIQKDFGSINSEVLELNRNLVDLAKVSALKSIGDAASALKSSISPGALSATGDYHEVLGVSGIRDKRWAPFRDAIGELDTAKGPQEQLRLYESIGAQILAATGGIEQMNSRQLEFYSSVVRTEAELRRMVATQLTASREAEVMGGNGRQGAMNVADGKQPRFNAEDLADARQMLATLQEEAALRDLINIKGRDSAAVALARAEAERAAYAEQVKSLEVAGPLKDELMAAWDAANGIARARIAGAIEAALGPASRLRGILSEAAAFLGSIAAGETRRRADLATQYRMYGQGSSAARDAVISDSPTYGGNGNGLSASRESQIRPTAGIGRSGGGGGGGAGAARAEADAVAELVARLRDENEAIQVLDPVQAEMLKHRKVLKDATEAERAEVERLVESNQRLKAVQQAAQYASNTVGEFLQGIIVRGQSAGDVLRNLAAQFLSMAANSFITGQGWFAQLLGISGPMFGSKIKLADGGSPAGMVLGAGGPRDDMIDARLSAGEFVMNARATQRYRPVLERMNSGNVPGFANGGAVGRGAASASDAGPSGMVINVAINGATGNEEVGRMVRQGIEMGLREFSSQVLPGRVQQVLKNPRIVGV